MDLDYHHHCPLVRHTAVGRPASVCCGPFRRRSCAALDWCDTELWSRNNCSMRQGSLGTPHASRVATAALSAECWRWRWRVLARALAGPGRHVSLCVPCWTSRPVHGVRQRQRDVRGWRRKARACGFGAAVRRGIDLRHSFCHRLSGQVGIFCRTLLLHLTLV